ncbi:hypothetical protein [Roseococcus suduntuyensis]|uniref:Uncharacterized protein n=1 Tax=Roseococcus suduntuyensis TaxID=455361 RepID=A0A840AAA3_9PROT|nr:hypothetical protein [Roseococcus suduntuyensis]MBB3898439.1 hypothetical protein [Roseococcus suduntuyensis]
MISVEVQKRAQKMVKQSQGKDQPLTDWAPFAVPDAEAWRELQRRRHLIRQVDSLSQIARDEGYFSCYDILSGAADRLRQLLILTARFEEPMPAPPRVRKSRRAA